MTRTRACALHEIGAESALAVEVDGVDVALVRSDGRVFAIRDMCSHAAVALSEGEVEHGEIECWLHGSRFDLATGRPTGLPAYEPVDVYPVTVQGDDVFVDVQNPMNALRQPSAHAEESRT